MAVIRPRVAPRTPHGDNPVAAQTRALVAYGGATQVVSVDLPALSPGDVLVRVSVAGVCGCVRDAAQGSRDGTATMVLGHEGVGTVEAVGRGMEALTVDGVSLAPGMRVTWGREVACGECHACVRTRPCRTPRVVGQQSLHGPWTLSGSLAQAMVLPAGALIALVPTAVPDVIASLTGCAVASVASAFAAAGDVEAKRLVVLGAGVQGLVAVAMAAELGARSVTIVDPRAVRRQRALEFGADAALAPAPGYPRHDVVLDVSGGAGALGPAVEALDPGGIAVVGRTSHQRLTLDIDVARLSRERITLTGVGPMRGAHLQKAVDFLATSYATRPWGSVVCPPVPWSAVTALPPLPDELGSRVTVAMERKVAADRALLYS
ncbi:alcohol dehydrogenase catalytic domain-containing protein [Demequina sp. B12]|uniref:alcohol dehydrogenase catalytic domain-containing protein n=1 Tax=Demequina sp. B12 TaxID=2992757 RepID=UPI00237A178F|nr:alcohol dehydrogenase catalytic domain-containing protein [Demequina sp. B12]MDE0573380.1 alcohol dehydrogenase catalytic domain-containing protein [Demequina sp. B12]